MNTSTGFDESVAELVGAAVNSGVIASEADLELGYLLAVEVVARREGYLAGQRSVKDASLDVCGAADWRRVSDDLGRTQAALEYRQRMIDPAPRAGDFSGVGVAIRKGQAEGTVRRRGQKDAAFDRWNGKLVETANSMPSPYDFAEKDDLSGNDAGIYHLADGVSDERPGRGAA